MCSWLHLEPPLLKLLEITTALVILFLQNGKTIVLLLKMIAADISPMRNNLLNNMLLDFRGQHVFSGRGLQYV